MSGYDDDNDGGLREWAEKEEKELNWGERDAAALKAHREWVKKFNQAKEPSNAEHQ